MYAVGDVDQVWTHDMNGVKLNFQAAATREKSVLEDEQRRVHRELEEKSEDWCPRYFELDTLSVNPHSWVYKYKE